MVIKNLKDSLLLVRISPAFVFFYFGIDKSFHPAVRDSYAPSWFVGLLPFKLTTFTSQWYL